MDTLISPPTPEEAPAQAAAPAARRPPTLIIIIAVAVLALGVGGYFAYSMFIAPALSPYAKIIPQELKAYAVGANADAFLIIKNDKEISGIISEATSQEQVKDFKSAILIGNVKKQDAVFAVSFGTAESVKQLQTLYEESIKKNPPADLSKTKVEFKDKVIVISQGMGMSGFTGSLSENPGFTSIDKQFIDSQLIAYVNNAQMPEVTMGAAMGAAMLGGLIGLQQTSAAPAQSDFSNSSLTAVTGAISLSKNTRLYIMLKSGELKSSLRMDFMSKAEFLKSPIAEMVKSSSGKDPSQSYDEMMKTFEAAQPDLQKIIDKQTSILPGIKSKIILNQGLLSLDLAVPQAIAEIGIMQYVKAQESAPASARDAERKVHVNDIVMTLEQYNAVNNKYPQKSACVDEISEIQSLFMGGKPPVDSNSPIDFKAATCKGGFYYQYAPKGEQQGYVVWAKMEGENGNTNGTPDEYIKAEQTAGVHPEQSKNGKYYIVDSSPYYKPESSSIIKLEPLDFSTEEQIPDAMLTESFSLDARPIKDPTGVEFKINAAPGETVSDSATVRNYSIQSGTVSVYAVDKSTDTSLGKKEETKLQVGLWTTVEKPEITLKSGERQTVNFAVAVPPGTAPGTYLGYLNFKYQYGTKGGFMTSGLKLTVNVTGDGVASGTSSSAPTPVKRIKRTP